MASKHGRRHDIRQAKFGAAWTNSRPLWDAAALGRLLIKTGEFKTAMDKLGKLVVTFRADFDAFRRELAKGLEARERSLDQTELP